MERYSEKSKIKRIKTKKGILFAEIIENPGELDNEIKTKLTKDIRELVTRCWGDFGENFIESHVLGSFLLLILCNQGKLIGLASISEKKVLERKIPYFELTVIDPAYRGLGFSKKLNFLLIKRLFLRNILKGKLKLEFMVITPNVRVLGSLAKVASFIYPNPNEYDKDSRKLPDPDIETWKMAKDLIKNSDHPDRKLQKNGCVLEGSYAETPWLIYDGVNIPKHKDEDMNEIGKQYLGYGEKKDREFVVRVIFKVTDLLKYLVL